MRNLKRALSLALAAIMLIGMMVMGTSAASLSDFADAGDITHTEAAAVINGLEIMKGDNSGFRPNDTITRAEMATVILKMLYGANVNASIYGGLDIFDDCDGHWAEPAINMAYTQGIISGVGDGKFDPDAQVTVAEATTMLVKALGISCPGTSWPLNVMSKASELKLFGDLNVTANMPMIRDNIAVLCLEGLQYSPSGTGGYKVGDYTFDSLLDAYIFSGADVEQIEVVPAADSLGARVFGLSKSPDTDDFGHTVTVWTATNGMSVEVPGVSSVLTYTAKVSESQVAKDLAGYSVVTKQADAADVTVAIGSNGNATHTADIKIVNGADAADLGVNAITSPATAISDLTGNGKVVEIYATGKTITKIIVTEYTVGKLVIGSGANPSYTVSNLTAAGENVVAHGSVTKGDVVTAVKANDILHIYPTTQIAGVQTGYNRDATNKTITIDGTVYTVGTAVKRDAVNYVGQPQTLGGEARYFYVDLNGYVVSDDSITTAASTQYAQMIGTFVSSVNTTVDGKTPSVQARFVLGDGTVGIYNVALTKDGTDWKLLNTTVLGSAGTAETLAGALSSLLDDGKVFGYTLNGDTISLESLTAISGSDITQVSGKWPVVTGATSAAYTGATTANLTNSKTALITSSTVFVLYDAATRRTLCVTGAANLPKNTTLDSGSAKVVMTAINATSGVADVVFGVYTEGVGSSGEYAYVDADTYAVTLDSNGNQVRTYTGIAPDGSTVTLHGPNGGANAIAESGVYNYNEDFTFDCDDMKTGSGITAEGCASVVTNSLITVDGGTNYYAINENTQTAYIGSGLSEADGNMCIVVYKNGVAQTIYVVQAYVAPTVFNGTVKLSVDVSSLDTTTGLPTTATVEDSAGTVTLTGVTASISWKQGSTDVADPSEVSKGEYTGTITVDWGSRFTAGSVTYNVYNGSETANGTTSVTAKVYELVNTVEVTITGDLAITTDGSLPTVTKASGEGKNTGVSGVTVSWEDSTGNAFSPESGTLSAGTYTGTITATADEANCYKMADGYKISGENVTAGKITVTVTTAE